MNTSLTPSFEISLLSCTATIGCGSTLLSLASGAESSLAEARELRDEALDGAQPSDLATHLGTDGWTVVGTVKAFRFVVLHVLFIVWTREAVSQRRALSRLKNLSVVAGTSETRDASTANQTNNNSLLRAARSRTARKGKHRAHESAKAQQNARPATNALCCIVVRTLVLASLVCRCASQAALRLVRLSYGIRSGSNRISWPNGCCEGDLIVIDFRDEQADGNAGTACCTSTTRRRCRI